MTYEYFQNRPYIEQCVIDCKKFFDDVEDILTGNEEGKPTCMLILNILVFDVPTLMSSVCVDRFSTDN